MTTSDYGRGVVRAALWEHRLVEAGCSCGLTLDVRTDEWAGHAAQAVADALRTYELRVVSATDTAAEVANEVRLIEDHHGSADDRPVALGMPLTAMDGLTGTNDRVVVVPWDAGELARTAAAVVAHEEASAAAGVGPGPSLHDLLLADVFAALAVDDPDRWYQAMVRVAATAVWCAPRGQW